VFLEAVLVPMLCVGMRSGGSASLYKRQSRIRAVSRLCLDTRAILLMNYSG
jgi:hypothetical protein